ncbi:type VI secretion system baseplate subunit TssE [Sulfitobacter mediterraneus]|jgi:type VI secretion system protein ImpF|uniref:Type VI secretion system protein ImpF n=1 Tax=Sulfitobacter mediterraneus TaxID=83219 RepID=A0A2T6C8Y9_9RHOB|nr:type VI secretion system baseplate subunit TssE [Sulfitobacter mediterraneus]KIN75704.1 Type VI secretion system lysozyme-related protein [Sulfitobacter mediterraneus KCTC 32188]PTX64769.1 type VI secretion system protein ImpF [Sulfitobacter mediterraneus]UWR12401.1 type VI secretion system baseplate subunit TssE [Sulfitobacter mediterraneus]
MADRTLTERLQPSILDRLTDEAPQKKTETTAERMIDIRRLREIIQRDLSWLLNTGNIDSEIDADLYPNVSQSVLNYGVPDATGDYANLRRAANVRDAIQKAVELFEPRLIDGSLNVISRTKDAKREPVITFDIVGDMWAQPLPTELYLRSQFDTTTGQVTLEQGA